MSETLLILIFAAFFVAQLAGLVVVAIVAQSMIREWRKRRLPEWRRRKAVPHE